MAFFEGLKMTGGYGTGPDIINSCSVDVNRGEIVSILGPNGAGKSTAMKALLSYIALETIQIMRLRQMERLVIDLQERVLALIM